jgi:putative FmdB family regulatory protein
MPIYTYRCENCGVQFERQQSFSDAPLTRCPECSKKSLRKVYTPVGIVFKGSGFYATDNRSPSGASRQTTEKKTGEGDTKSGESETKSAEAETKSSTSSESTASSSASSTSESK